MSIAPHDICRRLGEARFKEMFLSLNAAAMKASVMEAGMSTARLPSQTSTRKRNDDWAKALWNSYSTARPAPSKVLVFEWLRQTQSKMLTYFLDTLNVPHTRGLTDADFMTEIPEEKLVATAKLLLAHPEFSKYSVAAYLLFLDNSNETNKFASLQLEHLLAS